MITTYSLSNFKGFKKLENLELSPLTILVGKNSCGKSSILHSLLLLKQSLENTNQEKALTIEGKYLNYSSLREMTFGQPAINKCEISFEFKTHDSKKICLAYKSKKIEDHQEIILSKYRLEENKKNLDLLKITKKNIDTSKFGKDFILHSHKIEIDREKFIPENFKLISNYENKLITPIELQIPFSLFYNDFNIQNELKNELKNLRFLSPIRATPNRAYLHYSDDSNELLSDGSNSAHILWTKRNKKVKLENKELNLIDAVNQCINSLGLSQEITPERIGNLIYQLNLSEKSFNKKVSISDVGFGYSQILPVILIGLLNNNENLILVEQPEIHLHPSSAANLADLFLSFIEDKKRFLIETHSQEFINRLRLRVIENPELKSKINIVFIDQDKENGANTKQFQIDENGMFPEWPDGFIDESEKLANAILKARIQKAQKK